jgi:DNA transformation protein
VAASRKNDPFKQHVLEQLNSLDLLTCRAMFGGHGLYLGNRFFAILYRGKLYFRTNDVTREEYEDRGMEPFRPGPRQVSKCYYEVPPDVLEDAEALVSWARTAAGVSS